VNGIDCWDLNMDGVADPLTEDLNGDTVVDVNDCTGPQGPPGPPGSTTMNAETFQRSFAAVGAACTTYMGASVALTVAGPGTIVVTAAVMIRTAHTTGLLDEVDLYLRQATTNCLLDGTTMFTYTDPALPTGVYFDEIFLQDQATVMGAGTFTYYVNGRNFGDTAGADQFWHAHLVMTVYPS
jgi:hypothetical protein